MGQELEFLDIDLETKEARAQLKARCVDGWKLIWIEKSLHSNSQGRDFSRHLVIIERDTSAEVEQPIDRVRNLK